MVSCSQLLRYKPVTQVYEEHVNTTYENQTKLSTHNEEIFHKTSTEQYLSQPKVPLTIMLFILPCSLAYSLHNPTHLMDM